MASDFVGYTILVTLQSPPNAQIQGVVANVVHQKLFLQDVLLLWNGQRLASYAIDSSAIADLEVSPTQPSLTATTTAGAHEDEEEEEEEDEEEERLTTPTHAASGFAAAAPSRSATFSTISQPQSARFPTSSQSSTIRTPVPMTISQIQQQAFPRKPTSQPQQNAPAPLPTAIPQRQPHPQPQADGMAAFLDPAIISYTKPPTKDGQPASAPPVRDSLQAHPVPQTALPPVSPIMIADGLVSSPSTRLPRNGTMSSVSSIGPGSRKKMDKRNTSASATLTEPFDALRLSSNVTGVKVPVVVDQEPEVPEVVSQTGRGIIDMKDINHGSLKQAKKAGKGKGWRQTPLIEEVPRPTKKKAQRGRKGGEDVNGWATEDATDIQDLGEFDFEGNLSKFDKRQVFDDIRRADTTADADRLVSFNRKARPGTNGGRNLHFTENVLDLPDVEDKARWQSEAGETENEVMEGHYSSGRGSRRAGSRRPMQSRKGSVLPAHLDRTESPRPLTRMPTASPLNGSVSGSRASFKLENNKPCHCLSPLQMLEIEQLCTSELGLTEDMLSENAGRSIATAVLKVSDVRNVVFLVGNHKSGARAIAAARQLRNRRLRVTVVVLGGEREEVLLEVMRKQLGIYRQGLGYVERWDEYQTKFSAGAAGGPPPDVVVDALLGVHVTFEELRTDDQATTLEMIRWANRSSAVLFSVDVPSGLSATSGMLTEVDGQALVMASRHIVSLGAPKTGLLHAMSVGGTDGVAEPHSSWQVWVADIGISAAAWQKHGSRRKHGVDFGTEWVVPLRFAPGPPG